ncbi:chemokine (C-X-C motif) ligand 32b, duplicate 1 [Danio aesculapii]|uniref:chemokine (C-X-C motif) ligand 32b, duplicate 1 n=1 Tax=Danio aesculapii TaxID=1142201 RepID=UPI0024BFFB2C|nr:chemokine (C-X-C motif) ligand 32b, duplicate 1 [Danio aesculapii]
MRSALITLLCLAVMLLVQVSCQISNLYCPCLKTRSDVVLRKANIKSYTTQRAGICHVDAIVFKTVKGITFCADPKQTWVKDAMKSLDKKKAAPRPKATAQPINSTFDATSMPNTTSYLNTTNTNTTSHLNTTNTNKTSHLNSTNTNTTTGQTKRLFTTIQPC